MADLFKTPEVKKENATAPQTIEFISTKKSKIKITYKPMTIGGIAKSPVLEANLKSFIDDFEKEAPVKEVKNEIKTS